MKTLKKNTETIPHENHHIDKLSISHALTLMLDNQAEAIDAVRIAMIDIEKASIAIFTRLNSSQTGRIVYCGAGTSARIGVQDGAELNPTFGWPVKRISFVIAGGLDTLISSKENVEDNKQDALDVVEQKKITNKDCFIAIAASGSTPFTLEAMKLAKKNGALTIGIANNIDKRLQKECDFAITLDTGTELVAGSTRLKAGTAQKICLNLLSTIVMTKLGFVVNGLMVNMSPKNNKLRKRYNQIRKLI